VSTRHAVVVHCLLLMVALNGETVCYRVVGMKEENRAGMLHNGWRGNGAGDLGCGCYCINQSGFFQQGTSDTTMCFSRNTSERNTSTATAGLTAIKTISD